MEIETLNLSRKIELYQMDFPENLNLEQMNVFAAPYGGPIAITKDPKQVTKAGSQAKPVIQIFTSSGHKIGTINVRGRSRGCSSITAFLWGGNI